MHDSAAEIISSEPTNHARRAFIACLIGNIFLAFGPWLVRLADVGPISSAFWRMTLAAPLLLAIALFTGGFPRRFGAWLWIMLGLSGLFFAADLASWHIGILHTKLANSTLFGNSTSLMFPIYGFLIARAWPSRIQALALLLAATGAGLLMGRSYELSAQNLIGDLLCLLAGLFYTFYLIAMLRARAALAPIPALALATLAGILPLLIVAHLLGETFWPQHWGPLILLALASQVIGQGLMIYAVAHLKPLVMGLTLLTQPVLAGTIGWLAYDERLGLLDFVGAAFVAAALVLVRRPEKPAALPVDQ